MRCVRFLKHWQVEMRISNIVLTRQQAPALCTRGVKTANCNAPLEWAKQI